MGGRREGGGRGERGCNRVCGVDQQGGDDQPHTAKQQHLICHKMSEEGGGEVREGVRGCVMPINKGGTINHKLPNSKTLYEIGWLKGEGDVRAG